MSLYEGGCAVEAPEAEINKQANRLRANLEDAEKRLALLTERLAPVLSHEPPSPSCGEAKALSGTRSPLANNLDALAEKAARLEASVNRILNRLELP